MAANQLCHYQNSTAHLGVHKSAYKVDNGIAGTDVGEELIAQALALAGT